MDGYTEAPELYSYLCQEQQNSLDSSLDDQRATAIRFYFGEPFGDEVVGKSQLVTRDVAETADYMLTSILSTLISSERVIQFEAKDQSNAQAADDASEVMQYQFMRQQDGYRILHDWIKLGLLEKTGVIKTWVEQRYETIEVEVPVEALEEQEDGSVTIDGMPVIESQVIAEPEPIIDDFGMPMGMTSAIHRARIKRPLPPRFRDEIVPNEEFLASPDARELDTSNYLGHQTPKSLSDLREMGYEFVDETLWSDGPDSKVIADARDSQRSRQDDQNWHKGPMRKVYLREEYAFWDLDEDGIAERIRVHRVGAKILGTADADPSEEQPFVEWCPFPMAGRRVGQSLADKVMDIQRVRSVLLRQGMDSLYLSTNPRTAIHEGSISENTIDDLLTPRSGALIRWTGQIAPQPWATLPVHEQAFSGMEMMSNERESRTGVTRLNQGLDPDVLNKANTATGAALLAAGGEQMELYVARNFVEAFARLAMKKYNLMRKYGQPFQIQVDGQFRTIDPRQWPADIDIRIRVGLGTGNKDRQIGFLTQAFQTAIEGVQQGSPLFTQQNAYNAGRALIAAAQIGNPSDFITQPPPDDGQPKQPPPDPKVIDAQTKQMQAQADIQAKAQKQQVELQIDQQSAATKLEIAREAAAQDAQLKRDRAIEESRLAQERQAFEMQQAIQQQAFNQSLACEQASAKAEQADALPSYRPGGDIAQ